MTPSTHDPGSVTGAVLPVGAGDLGAQFDPSAELGLLGDAVAESPPQPLDRLRRQIVGAARARPRVRPVSLGPVEALAEIVVDAAHLFDSLTAVEWATPGALGDFSVRDTVSHLTAADAYLGAMTGAWPGVALPTEHDHVAITAPFVADGRLLDDAALLERWRSTSDRLDSHLRMLVAEPDAGSGVAGRVAGVLASPSRYCVIEGPLGLVLIARAFELWTHLEDICRAVGRPPRPPSAGVLGAMTDVAADLVPLGYSMEVGGAPAAETLRLVLTGPGGGTWDRSLTPGGEVGEPGVVIVADAVEFCRLVARRVAPSELDCEVLGDAALASAVLAGSTRFAMD